jgi:inorganic pyrophosphatase
MLQVISIKYTAVVNLKYSSVDTSEAPEVEEVLIDTKRFPTRTPLRTLRECLVVDSSNQEDIGKYISLHIGMFNDKRSFKQGSNYLVNYGFVIQ